MLQSSCLFLVCNANRDVFSHFFFITSTSIFPVYCGRLEKEFYHFAFPMKCDVTRKSTMEMVSIFTPWECVR